MPNFQLITFREILPLFPVNQRVLGSSPRGGANSEVNPNKTSELFLEQITAGNYCKTATKTATQKSNYKMAKNLENDCYYTELWVSPKNWRSLTTKKSLKLQWYVQCKFYDPLFKDKYPYGFPFRKKVNKYRTLEERKEVIELLLKEIPKLLEDKGYNPITKKYMKIVPPPPPGVLHKDLPIMDAFRLATDKVSGSKKYLNQIRFALNRFEKAVKELRMVEITIYDFKRSELKTILEYLKLTDSYYNKFRAYLSSLFNELVEYDCCEINLTRDIRKRKITKKIRETLELDEQRQIFQYLKENYYEFYRYAMIFFLSGSRSSELLRLQKKDVQIEKQEYKITIQKGSHYAEEIKVILLDAIPYWQEVLEVANKNDYLFSKGLTPGPVEISPIQITIRWRKHVKNKLAFHDGKIFEIKELEENKIRNYEKITADFYSLKHLFLDLIDKGNNAQIMAAHTKDKTTAIYTINRKKKEREALKSLKIKTYQK